MSYETDTDALRKLARNLINAAGEVDWLREFKKEHERTLITYQEDNAALRADNDRLRREAKA